MNKSAHNTETRTRQKGGKGISVLCRVLGSLIIAAVIALCLPLALPNLLGYQVYEVVSGSMEPEIPQGSVLYVREISPSHVEEGAVIAFEHNDGVVAHRVETNRTSLGEFVTKGDANETEDLEPVPYDALLGEVVYHVPLLGHAMALYASQVGKVYLLLVLGCGVMLNRLAERLAEKQRTREQLEAVVQEAVATGVLVVEPDPVADDGAKQGQPRRRRRLRLRTVLMVLLAAVFVGSAGTVAYVRYSRRQSDLRYDHAAGLYAQLNDGSDPAIAPITIDFDTLCAQNEDVVGWIYCEGTPINYPVLHGKTNDEYLRHDYTREYNIDGSIFVDCDNRRGFVDANTIVYGHHMDHGAMFATLDKWADQKYYEKHPIMWLLTPTQDYQVVLVSGHHTSAYSDMYDIIPEHGDEFDHFLSEAVTESDFEPRPDATVNNNRNYIMLTTCAYIFDNARYVLHGKLVPVQSAGGVPLSATGDSSAQ